MIYIYIHTCIYTWKFFGILHTLWFQKKYHAFSVLWWVHTFFWCEKCSWWVRSRSTTSSTILWDDENFMLADHTWWQSTREMEWIGLSYSSQLLVLLEKSRYWGCEPTPEYIMRYPPLELRNSLKNKPFAPNCFPTTIFIHFSGGYVCCQAGKILHIPWIYPLPSNGGKWRFTEIPPSKNAMASWWWRLHPGGFWSNLFHHRLVCRHQAACWIGRASFTFDKAQSLTTWRVWRIGWI